MSDEPSMNENSRLHVFGRFFFKIRSFTPIPFILLLIYFSRPTFMSVAIGATLLCLGEGLRLWAVGYAGGGTRSRALSAASHLVTTGPYGRLRNPLYLGNLLLSLGTCVLANVYWMVVVLLVGYVVQYAPIIASEETYLRKTCGALYLAYCSVVPRFLPRLRPYADRKSVV